jgi:AraC-like DNA-binding protein
MTGARKDMTESVTSRPSEASAELTIVARVEKLIAEMLPRKPVSTATVAARLGISAPTLYRRLKAEGASFAELIDEVRRKLALHYIGEEEMPPTEASWRLGFSEPSSFTRSFKRWTGASPSAYRQNRG